MELGGFILIFCSSLIVISLGETDVVFPPILEDNVEGVQRGHLKPLGHQNEPVGHVKEYDHFLSAEEFWKNHGKDRIPLVYRQCVSKSPAIKLWTDEYLLEHYGDLDVLVEHKKENRSSSSGRMRLREFLPRYKNEDMYIVSMCPVEMMSEIQAVNTVLCGTWKNFTHESNFWMSNGGTRSVVHYDADHNFHCIIHGRKDFIMMKNNKEHRKILGIHRYNMEAGSGFSRINPDAINVTRTPDIYNLKWEYATLYAGDCIYIPRAHLHQVRSYTRTLAATTLFTEDTKMNFSSEGCSDALTSEYHTMAEINFHWTYKKGDQMIDMGFQNVELFRKTLLESIAEYGNFTARLFKKFVISNDHGRESYDKDKTKRCFNLLVSGTGKDYVDEELARKLTVTQLKEIVRLIEAPHGVVTDGKEEVLVRPGDEAKKERDVNQQDDSDLLQNVKNRLNSVLKSTDNKINLQAFKDMFKDLNSDPSTDVDATLVNLFENILGGKSKGFLDQADVEKFDEEQMNALMDAVEEVRGFEGQGQDENQGLPLSDEEGEGNRKRSNQGTEKEENEDEEGNPDDEEEEEEEEEEEDGGEGDGDRDGDRDGGDDEGDEEGRDEETEQGGNENEVDPNAIGDTQPTGNDVEASKTDGDNVKTPQRDEL